MRAPRTELLRREMHSSLKPQVDRVVKMMERCTNYGTHLIVKCDASSAAKEHLSAAIALGLHIIEDLDAASVLLRNSVVDPVNLILRSQMEAAFGLAYMKLDHTQRRCAQYIVAHAHSRIDWYKKLDPTTGAGKQLNAELKKDDTLREEPDDTPIVSLDTEAQIKNLESMLARPEYAEVEAEWQRLRGFKSGQIWWYNLFGGPGNTQALAEAVNDHGFYQLLYRMYSAEMHATNGMESYLPTLVPGIAAYRPLRYPIQLPMVAQFSVSLALRAYRALIAIFFPNEILAYSKWYTEEIRPDYNTLPQFRIVDPSHPTSSPKPRK